MDRMIQEIVKIDHDAAASVEDAKNKRQALTSRVNARKQEAYESYAQEMQTQLDQKKQETLIRIEAIKKDNDDQYAASRERLKAQYEEHFEEWVDEIVARCLKL